MFVHIYIVLLLEITAVLGVDVDQGPKVLVKAVGKTVYLPCKASGLEYIHWYQVKEGEAPSRLLYISRDGVVTLDSNPQTNDFTVDKTRLYNLKLGDTQKKHAAVYFCAYWDGYWIKRFGSGTRLIVTEPGKDNVKTPELSGYLNKATDKPVALCQARDMFPDLVSFKWEKKSNNEDWSEVPKEQIVEQSHNEDPVTSMVVPNTVEDNTYRCTVTHEGNTKNPSPIIIEKTEKKQPGNKTPDTPDPTCPPSTEKTPISQESDNPEKKQSLQLFVYGYAVMLMKNVLYFIVVFIVLLKRKAGKKEERS